MHTVIFLFSILVLFENNNTNNLNQYNKFYQTYLNEIYKELEYREKVEIAKEYIEAFKGAIKSVILWNMMRGSFGDI
ncbi:hypothetical protein ME9_01410 [Bartonella taylorii 8TBB]|uniref:Uncharacterized protein n=1 Tax=Bartonella taylorii 8TBB TaxID=1094560 RepID=A0A9P2RYF0_BARTA|nr:hypothetical protein ME9_01410 [Bartonella taylorii 8TBB]